MNSWSGMDVTGEVLKSEPGVRIVASAEDLARAAGEYCLRLALEAVAARGHFSIALAGGSTPKRLYALLAGEQESFRERFPWEKTHFFWGDERHVPPGIRTATTEWPSKRCFRGFPSPLRTCIASKGKPATPAGPPRTTNRT